MRQSFLVHEPHFSDFVLLILMREVEFQNSGVILLPFQWGDRL